MDWGEACNILGVTKTASLEEIRQQYHYKAQLLHPDKTIGKPESIRKKAEEEFKLVSQVYQFLTNPLNNPFTNPPRLKISPKHIRFKDVSLEQKKTTSFQIDSIGGDYTNIWIGKEPSPWLSVKSVKSTTTEKLPMEVTIECTGIGKRGDRYSCKLPVRLENKKTKLKDEAVVDIELWARVETSTLKEIQIPHTDAFKIREWLCSEFERDQGIDLRHDHMAMLRLIDAAETARVELSTVQQTEVNLPFITRDASGPKHLTITLTRSKLEQVNRILLDVTPLTIGIESPEGVMKPLIPRNTPIPVFKYMTMRTARDYQTSVEIHVLQGERPMAADNRTLARFVIDGIPPAPRGVSGFLVHFHIDDNGILSVSSSVQGKEQKITIRAASSGLSKEDVDKMKREAERYAADDARRKEQVEAMKDAKCPRCRHRLSFDTEMLFWRCTNDKCLRIYKYEEVTKGRRRGKPR